MSHWSSARQVKRAAPSSKPLRQAQSAVKNVGKASKGWLGGVSGPKGLDQWYGECPEASFYKQEAGGVVAA